MEKSKIINSVAKYVNKLLLPLDNHYYHHYDHALDVMERAVYLWKKENVSSDDLELLSISALFHDTGFVIQYDDNEIIWAKIARNFLKTILYPEEKIQKIEEIILATRPSYKTPKNILESIIKDADLDNLGRDDFFEKWDKLKKELETIKDIKIKEPDWHHSSLDILYDEYYTETQKKERWDKRLENSKKIKSMMEELDRMDSKPKYTLDF